MIGAEGVFRPPKYISEISLSTKLGFSNTVFKNTDIGDYSPYAPSGSKIMDSSNLLGMSLPFRYSANFKASMTTPLSLSLSMPVYSDPFFSDHFDSRNETMDWISFLIAQSQTDDDDTKSSTNEVSSFTWALNSSYSVPLPAFIKPYVSTLSLSLNSSLVFSTMEISSTETDSKGKYYLDSGNISSSSNDRDEWVKYTPERKFYYPSQIIPATITGTLSGTLIDLSSSKNSKKSSAEKNGILSLTGTYAFPLYRGIFDISNVFVDDNLLFSSILSVDSDVFNGSAEVLSICFDISTLSLFDSVFCTDVHPHSTIAIIKTKDNNKLLFLIVHIPPL